MNRTVAPQRRPSSDRRGQRSLARQARYLPRWCGPVLLLLLAAPALAEPTIADRLMGLSRVSWSDPRTELGWRYALPPWGWALIVIGALVVAGRSYTRLLGGVAWRLGLSTVRALIIVLIAALIAGPMAVLPQEQIEPDWLLVLVDRSASMQLGDVSIDEAGNTISRDEQMRRVLSEHATVFDAWGAMAGNASGVGRSLIWLGFDAGTYQIDPPYLPGSRMPEPRGRQTLLRTAIDQALQRVAGRPISGIVLLTDGRSPQPIGADLIQRLRQQAVGVYPVPLGAAEPPIDLALGRVDYPDKAMVDDIVPVTVWIDAYPSGANVIRSAVRARLIDTQSGQVLDEQTAARGGLDASGEGLRLIGRRDTPGQATWRVEVTYEGGLTPARELVTDNNAEQFDIEFVDEPIRVLYVEGYPRWEYRYLKNLLIREASITSSIMLIEADREFAQEGDVPIARLPVDRQEIEPYDVIIIGDVPSQYWSTDQVTLIADQVSQRGAGLLWIGGERHTPVTYDLPPLRDLMPMRRPSAVSRAALSSSAVTVSPTGVARMLNVLRLRNVTDVGARAGGAGLSWPDHLSPLYYVQQLGPLKPTSEVLAIGKPATDRAAGDDQALPVIVRMRYGAGQSLYVGTDETWRWRFGRGDWYFDQFWIQLVQMLGRSRLQTTGRHRAWMNVSHRRIATGQTVVVEVTIDDPLLLRRELRSIAVSVERPGEGDVNATRVDQVELLPEPAGDGEADRAGPQRFTAMWTPGPAAGGDLMLRVSEPALTDLNIVGRIEVTRPDDEMLEPAADHERLTLLAQQTGGQVVPPDELDTLTSIVPNRARKTPADISEPLWHSPLALILAVTLLTVEWIGRKVIRLV